MVRYKLIVMKRRRTDGAFFLPGKWGLLQARFIAGRNEMNLSSKLA